jgi:autotransporter-associated beta strand protein
MNLGIGGAMRRRSAACAIATLGVVVGAGSAGAGLTYDLRFSDGTRQKSLATDFVGAMNLELWARVSGTDSDHTNEGLVDSYLVLQSSETGDLFDGGLGNGLTLSPFNTGRNGTDANLTNDGVRDWGSTVGSIENSHYMYAKSPLQVHGGEGNGQAVDGSTWEFRIASFVLSVSGMHPVGNDETRIVVTRPSPTFPVVAFAHYFQDDVPVTVTNQQFAGVYGAYVSLVGSSSCNWDGGPGGAGNEWTTAADWANDAAPSSNSIATFGSGGSATVVGINMGALPGNTTTVGMIRLDTDANRSISIQNSSAVAGTLSLSGVSGLVLDNQSVGRTLTLSGSGVGALSIALPSAATINVSNAASTINLSASIITSTLITKSGAGTLIIGGNQQSWTGGLQVTGGKVVVPANNAVRYLNTLSVATGSTLDLNDNDLVVNNGSFATLQSLAFEGYSGGLDTAKTGIISTTSQGVGGTTILALFDNALAGFSDYPPGSGNSIATGAIVGKYTYIGDTNYDGQVTPQDYTATDSNLGTSVDVGISWFYGDTNFDGNIDATDYAGVDGALGLGQGNPLALHAIPEPAVFVPLALAHLAMRKQRRRLK